MCCEQRQRVSLHQHIKYTNWLEHAWPLPWVTLYNHHRHVLLERLLSKDQKNLRWLQP